MIANYESKNEPVKLYKPGSSDKKNLLNEYYKMTNEIVEIPIIIGGKEFKTGDTNTCVMPHESSTYSCKLSYDWQ